MPDYGSPTLNGLSEEEATRLLNRHGFNELPSARKRRGTLWIAFSVIREPMFLLLVGAGILYFILGDLTEALLLLSFVVVIIAISIYQERKTERTLEALRDLSSPRALVIRGGERKRIVGREVVPGDILVLCEGDRVPADAVVLSCTNLMVNESLLTGEAVPVRKIAADGPQQLGRPGGDDLPFVFSGTLVVSGQGIARVEGTGASTEIGRVGKSLESVESEPTPLQKETRRLVVRLATVGLSVSAAVAIVYALTKGSWIQGLLAGITLGMAVLPEEFPVVLTLFLALGAWRISKLNVLTRRAPAIETMGSTTVLCSDKTGTLTQNRMEVGQLRSGGLMLDAKAMTDGIPEGLHELVEFAILASEKDPFDPMERAFKDLGEQRLAGTGHLHRDWELAGEYELSQKLLALSHVWKSPSQKTYIVAAKGAPEAIADLCHMDETARAALTAEVSAMAGDGLRVLGVARADFPAMPLPSDQHEFAFRFLGLVGLHDPIRPTVPQAVRECYAAGVRVVMITGDHPRTAQAIARQIGLASPEQFLTGDDLARMGDGELCERVRSVNIFARVLPEHKLRLVSALKQNGEVVAMTGDGVNDAPALKAADIGVAMGGRGTDVAREAASLVVLDDDFASIVAATRMGRRIFDNLRKAMAFIFAVHVPIIGLSLIPLLLKWPIVLMPVHIVFLELIIDPACTLVFEAEPEERDVMARPPRDPSESVFNLKTLALSLLQGGVVLAIVLATYWLSLHGGIEEGKARAMAFTVLVLASLGLILSNRSWTRGAVQSLRVRNGALAYVAIGAAFFLAIALFVPWVQGIFRFSSLGAGNIALCIGAALLTMVWFEAYKYVANRRRDRQPTP